MNPTTSTPRRTLATIVALALALLALPSLASAKDRNDDNIPDRWEKRHDLSLKVDQAKRDQDRDGLGNRQEFRFGMDPRDDDSDDDGTGDGDENSGKIASFDAGSGTLVIDLIDGSTVSGTVTDATEIECDDGDDQGDEDGDDQGSDDPAGDDDDQGGDDRSLRSGESESESDDEVACSQGDLVPGALVQEAELSVSGGSPLWEEIELLK